MLAGLAFAKSIHDRLERSAALLAEARARAAGGQPAAALAGFREGVELAASGDRPRLRHELAGLELAAGERAAAERTLAAAVRQDPAYRAPPELELRLSEAIPILPRLRFEAGLAVGSHPGFTTRTGSLPPDGRFVLISSRREAKFDDYLATLRSRVASFAAEWRAAYPGTAGPDVAAFHQASREHPRRLFYLARFTPGPTGEPDMAFAPADGPIERQEDRDAAWIRELGLEPLAYYWLYAKSFRTAAPQVKALRELLARVDPEELWRFLAWDGLLSRAVTGDEDGTTRYHPNKAEGVPDVVIQDLVRRFDRGILAGLTDGWGKEIGLLARQVAQKRSLPPG